MTSHARVTRDATDRPSLRAWLIWALGAFFFGYAFFQRVAPSVIVEDLMRDFAVGGTILGNLSAFYFYAYASLQVPVGVVVDRLGPRRVLTLSACVAALGGYLFATADQLSVAYLGRFLIGTGCAFAFISTLTLVTAWFPHRYLAMLAGLTMAFGTLGGLMAQAPLAAVVEVFSWRPSLLAAAAVPPLLALAIFFVVRDRPPEGPLPEASPQPERPRLLDGLKLACRRPQTWFIALYGGMMAGPLLAFGGLWGVPFLMQVYGYERATAALITSSMLVGWSVGAPIFGWLSDRLGRRKPAMVGGAALACLSMIAVVYVRDLPLPLLAGLLFFNGVASGAMTNCFAAIREHNPGPAVGAAFSIVNTANVAAGALLQPLIGYLLDLGWRGAEINGARIYDPATYDSALLILPVGFGVGVLAALLVRETWCRPVSPEASPIRV